jgi:HEPN domain-containing protein
MNAIYSGHQSLEKVLKALLAARNTRVVHIHKVVQLAATCGYSLTPEQLLELDTIDQFYIAAKYHSTKSKVYKLCTPQYVDTWTKIIRKWHKHFKLQVLKERVLLPNNTAAAFPEDIY